MAQALQQAPSISGFASLRRCIQWTQRDGSRKISADGMLPAARFVLAGQAPLLLKVSNDIMSLMTAGQSVDGDQGAVVQQFTDMLAKKHQEIVDAEKEHCC